MRGVALSADRETDGHAIEFRSVEYDVASTVAQLVGGGLPGRGYVLREYCGVSR